jgi:hypothetical protein
MCGHLRRSRPEKLLNVFQRIHLRSFRSCGLASDRTSLASSRTAMSDRLLTHMIHERFCCNRGFAAATGPDGGRARRSPPRHTVASTPWSFAAVLARLAWRLSGTRCASTATGGTRRTVMNNAGYPPHPASPQPGERIKVRGPIHDAGGDTLRTKKWFQFGMVGLGQRC